MNELLTLLADAPKNTGPDFGKASPFGLLIVVILLIGVFVLVWSMNRHLKKLPETFDQEAAEPLEGEAAGAASEEPAGAERNLKESPHEPGG